MGFLKNIIMRHKIFENVLKHLRSELQRHYCKTILSKILEKFIFVSKFLKWYVIEKKKTLKAFWISVYIK